MDSNIRDNLSQSSLDQYFTDNPQEIQKQIDGLYEADVKGTISPLKEELTEGASKIGSVFREQVTKTELPEHSGSSQPSVSISREQAVTTKIIVAAEAILNKQNKSLLDQAIATGDAAKLQYLIKNGVSINRVYHDGETPLTAAIKNHDAHAITFLLSQGASLDVYNSDCYVPVMIAGVYFPQSLPIFIQAGVDVTSGPFPLLNVIIQLNHKEGFAELEKRQFDFSVKDKSGKNIVLYSVSKEEQALHFLEAKGLLRKLDKAEKTQLFFHFLRRGFHEAAVSVLKSGIDFSAVDPRTKSSVFMSAVEAKNETAAKLIANSPEFDPAEIHKLQNNFVLELKYAGDLNETALSYLLAAGVDPGIPDPCGITLFDYCLWRSSPASEPRFDVGLAEKLVANMKDPLTYIQNLPLSATDKTAILQANRKSVV